MKKIPIVILIFLVLVKCTTEETVAPIIINNPDPLTDTSAYHSMAPFDCLKCAYTVPDHKNLIDGDVLGIKPGDFICLDAATPYKNIRFANINGTKENPITIINCGGLVNINGAGQHYGIKTEACTYFSISGSGSNLYRYGITISGPSHGIQLGGLSTHFDVTRVEVHDVGFAGIMAKTDPSCDDATIRGNFVMEDVNLYNNYIHDTGGEGFYIGNSFYEHGMTLSCGVRLPHDVHNVKIFMNTVKRSGWDGIQLGSATAGAMVFNNYVIDAGKENIANQRSGIQIGEGSGGLCFNNYIENPNGNGLTILGYGDNVVYNNVIVKPNLNGIFCDERFTPGPGFNITNNTLVSPGNNGILIYAELVPMNVLANNLIVNPGNLHIYPDNTDRAFINKLADVKVDLHNNLFVFTVDDAKFNMMGVSPYMLTTESPAVNTGFDVSSYGITIDFLGNKRANGEAFDVGAYEFY